MTDAEIDALWIAHRESGDMHGFGRAVADEAYAKALKVCDDRWQDTRLIDAHHTGVAMGAEYCANDIHELRGKR